MVPATLKTGLRRTAVTGVGAAGVVLALAYASGALAVPDVGEVLSDLSDSLGDWTYLVVPALAFLETAAFIGLVVPGETAVLVGGVVAERGDVSLGVLIGLVWIAAVAGDTASFLLGRRLGRPFLQKHGPKLRIRPEHIDRVESFFAQHGGKAIVIGRFAGILRALTPFVAGTSGLALQRFLAYSALGSLAWAATFTIVGYAFSDSFTTAGDVVTRVTLAGVVLLVALLWLRRSGRLPLRRKSGEAQGEERGQPSDPRSYQAPDDDVEREVHAQVHARQRHGRRQDKHRRTQPRAQHGDGRRGRESGRRVTRGERGIVRDGDERPEPGVGLGRALAPEDVLELVDDQRRGEHGGQGRGEGQRRRPVPEVVAEGEGEEQRSLDPPGRQRDEQQGETWSLDAGSELDEPRVEVQERGEDRFDDTSVAGLLVIVNARASGVRNAHQDAHELAHRLRRLGSDADGTATETETALWDALRSAAAAHRRVLLVGGDGALHAAVNAPLARLPELALLPAGRANNVARALGIPEDPSRALALAAYAPARPIDVLRVQTPGRRLYAVEALSAGFHAAARAGYHAENSADLLRGARALVSGVARFVPYRASVRFDDGQFRSGGAAQLFVANLPYFGFGFLADPVADPQDGRLEVILIEATSRRRLLARLAAVRRGRHLEHRDVRWTSSRRADVIQPLPLVADTIALGTTTATVTVDQTRIRVATPAAAGRDEYDL